MVKTNGGITTFDSGINISELNWNYSSSHPSIRRCNDVNVSGFNIYDKMGWQSDCRVNSFLNIYLSKPNNKKWFMIDIQGKNIPKKLLFVSMVKFTRILIYIMIRSTLDRW